MYLLLIDSLVSELRLLEAVLIGLQNTSSSEWQLVMVYITLQWHLTRFTDCYVILILYLQEDSVNMQPLENSVRSCEIGRSFAEHSLKIHIFSFGISHWIGRGGHMNTQGGGTYQEKNIPIKRHFASLIFGVTSPLMDSGPPDKYSYEISKPKLVYI